MSIKWKQKKRREKTEKNGHPVHISSLISMHWTAAAHRKQEAQDYGYGSYGNGQNGDGDGDTFYGQNGEGEEQRQEANGQEGEKMSSVFVPKDK